MSIQADTTEVLQLVQQFLHEQGLSTTVQSLQQETGTFFNSVPSLPDFVRLIQTGEWEKVLSHVAHMKLPKPLLFSLYAQVILELMEISEFETAFHVLKQTEQLHQLKTADPTTFLRLEKLIAQRSSSSEHLYANLPKQQRRDQLAREVEQQVKQVPPGRLLTLMNQALKWQQFQGTLHVELDKVSLFDDDRAVDSAKRQSRGGAVSSSKEKDMLPTRRAGSIKFGKTSRPECCAFAPNGTSLVTGSMEGFIEIWNPDTCKLRKELKYQLDPDSMMMHDSTVLTLDVSPDSEMIASGCQDGRVCVWRISNGKCLRKFEHAHSGGTTAVVFSRDGSQVASGGGDHVVKVHGLVSGRTLKELRGHTSFVNTLMYTVDDLGGRLMLLSGSSDGTIKVWNPKTMENTDTIRLPQKNESDEITVKLIVSTNRPQGDGEFLVCNRSSTLYRHHVDGRVLQSYSIPAKWATVGVMQKNQRPQENHFQGCAVSPCGKYVYGVGGDNHMYCFDTDQKTEELQLVKRFPVSDKDVLGLVHHPHRNVIVTYGTASSIRVWKP